MSMFQSVTSRIRWYHVVGLVMLVVVLAAGVWYWLECRRSGAIGESDDSDLVEDGKAE